ncbi:PIG-X [Melanogaster broomeanus]|nr:PIG-X [Melanogaster broomeanus]
MSEPTIISHSLEPRRGFHSTLVTKIGLDSPAPDCSVFALYTFPPSIIIDRYELIDRRLSFEFWGESNLELPVFAVNQTSNSILLLNATSTDSRSKDVSVNIPIHARYGVPIVGQLTRCSIEIAPPICFWACPSSGSSNVTPESMPPTFSSERPIAHSTMLQASSRFLVSAPSSHHPTLLEVPVASLDDLSRVETGTATIILVAFLWLVYHSWRVANALQSHHLKEQ